MGLLARLFIVGLALLAPTGARAGATAAACPRLSVAMRTSPNANKRMPNPIVRAGNRVKIVVKVANAGPSDVVKRLVVGVELPDYLLPIRTAARPNVKNKTMPFIVDQRNLYWVGLSLPARNKYTYVARVGWRVCVCC